MGKSANETQREFWEGNRNLDLPNVVFQGIGSVVREFITCITFIAKSRGSDLTMNVCLRHSAIGRFKCTSTTLMEKKRAIDYVILNWI
jgi:hypothetical protein